MLVVTVSVKETEDISISLYAYLELLGVLIFSLCTCNMLESIDACIEACILNTFEA